MTENTPNNQELSLGARLESLLFVASDPVTIKQLASALDTTPRQIEKSLSELSDDYYQRGIQIQQHRGKVQLTTAPESAKMIEEFLRLKPTSRLSQAALETLAIIAYQQPVTRPQIDSIRGVSSDGVIKNLLGRGIVEESGRAGSPGRPILYSTTPEFLQRFGISSLKDLPPLDIDLIDQGLISNDKAAENQIPLLKD